MDIMTLAIMLGGISQIEEKIKAVEREGFKVQVEENKDILDIKGEEKIFYFIPKDVQTPKNGYDEYIYANNKWELVGGTDIDFNYELLSNKPQINNHILSDNTSSDDLGLQKKLTAGTNITIENDGTISASGGTTDYTELENKPSINNVALQGNKTSDELGLQGKLAEGDNREIIGVASNGVMRRSGYYFTDSKNAIVDQLQSKVLIPNAQAVAQAIDDSKIVSGSINENGHIEFTDSSGNKFTTTGESVISAQGDDGFSPSATVTQTQSGATVTITDKNGTTTANISNGADWVPTAAEKSAIASEAAGMINVPTKTSQLQNDSGFLTQHQDISAKEDKSNKISAITSANRSSTAQYTTPKAVADFVGQVYTPEQYGAKGDGVTDDKSAIEAMLADIPDNALCVFYGNYYISAGITITRPVNITMYGKIVVAPTADFCMRISGHDVRKNTFRLNLETTSISGQWDGTYHTIGLDLYSTWENTIDVNVCNFNVGVRLISDNRDCTYNKLFIRYIFNCKTAILLTGDSTLFGGTTAQNTFVGGRVGASGDCLNYLSDSDTEDCYFPLNSELVRGRTNNNNNFVSVSFECGFAKDIEGKTNRAKINANYNYGTMIGCRFEGVTSFYGYHYISLVGGYGFDNIPNKSGGYSAIGVNDMHVNGYTAPIKIARNGNGGNIVEAINANGNKVWSLDSNGYSTNRAILLSPNEQTIIFPTSFMKIRGVAASNPTDALTALSNFEWGLSNYGFLVLKNSAGKSFIVQPIYTSAPPNPVAGTHALIGGKPMWFNGDEWVYANGDTTFSIPTKVSDLTNDAGYLTLSSLPIYNGGVQ